MSPAGRAAAGLAVLSLAGPGAQAGDVYTPDSYSYDTVTDPRAIAMGESSVADAGNPAAAFSSNPANLAFVSGPAFFSNYRSFNWFEDDRGIDYLHAWSVGVASAAPSGGMAFSFSRRGLATSDSREYNQTFSLAYALSRGNMAAGGALRFFNRYFHVDWQDVRPDLDYGWSYLGSFDLGVLYHARGSAGDPQGLSVGMALQNYSSEHVYRATSETGEVEHRTSLPLYLRTGIRYALDRPSTEISPPLGFVMTAEYRRFLNPPAGRGFEESDDIVRDADFGGIGFELTLYRWLSLRTGWINGYQDRHRLYNRYGLGIDLSPDRGRLPGQVGLDYALIRVPEGWLVESTRFVHSLGLRMSW